MFHVKDAEFNPTGRQRVYGGYALDQPRRTLPFTGRWQVVLNRYSAKMAAYDFPGWAVMEWECCSKHPEDGAAEGAVFIGDHIIRVTDKGI